jgi:hypothetical protein
VKAVGCKEHIVVGGGRFDAEPVGESHDAAASIAAHHPPAAIRIVELHPEIRHTPRRPLCGPGIIQNHQTIRPVLPAKLRDALRPAESVHISPPAVQNDEVIPGTGHLICFSLQHLSV